MSKLVIDTIEGKTSASTVNIKTNSITTNLQDVVPKFFACYGTVSSTAIINSHSLNMSSLTDAAVGGTLFTLTVNHATSTSVRILLIYNYTMARVYQYEVKV